MAAGCLAANCKSAGVKVPAAGADRAPIINLSNIVLAGSATVNPTEISSTAGTEAAATVDWVPKANDSVFCDIPRLQFVAAAHNPAGGVKSLHFVARTNWHGDKPIYDLTVDATTNPDGTVPETIPLLGLNDRTGTAPGSDPIDIAFDSKAGCLAPFVVTVTVTATNFNGQSTTLVETLTANVPTTCRCYPEG